MALREFDAEVGGFRNRPLPSVKEKPADGIDRSSVVPGTVGTGGDDPFVGRNIAPGGSSTSWGDKIRGLQGMGGGGRRPPAPIAITPQSVSSSPIDVPSPVEAQQINWTWQNAPGQQVAPSPPPAGGGAAGQPPPASGGGVDPWAVSQVNLGQYQVDPTLMQGVDNIQAQGLSDRYNQFQGDMYNRIADFMGQPTGYSDQEYDMLRGRAIEDIYAGAPGERQAIRQQLAQRGLLGSGVEDQMLQQAGEARVDRAAGATRDITLADMEMRRQGNVQATQMGMQFLQQQGQMEAQQQDLQAQIARNNQEAELAVQAGNMEAANNFRLQNQQLQAQSDTLNAQMQNSAMELRNQLQTQSSIAGMQTRAQRDIAAQNNALQREIAMNQMGFDTQRLNAQMGQEANMFNSGQGFDAARLNTELGQQAALANQNIDWQGQVFNTERMDDWNRANAAAAGAGRNWDRQMALQGAGQDIAQEQYQDQIMMQLLAMQNGQWNNMQNNAGQYGQQVYESNPNVYMDPYRGVWM